MDRPTLEDQIILSKMTREELIDQLMPHGLWQISSFWLHRHCKLLWCVVRWNWFDIWEGSENADEYRAWYIKLKIRLFGGNKG